MSPMSQVEFQRRKRKGWLLRANCVLGRQPYMALCISFSIIWPARPPVGKAWGVRQQSCPGIKRSSELCFSGRVFRGGEHVRKGKQEREGPHYFYYNDPTQDGGSAPLGTTAVSPLWLWLLGPTRRLCHGTGVDLAHLGSINGICLAVFF